jgi:Na+-translocating ferredoxin:NAD+ oxidoreductase RNF subunit RnfB
LKTDYNGATNCAISHSLFSGEKGCAYGCLGLGDCERVCAFDAITIDKERSLAVVDEEKCTGCNICVLECPRDIIELRPKGKKDRRIYVACNNNEKGNVAKKNCTAACIGCGKCLNECDKFNAISIVNNLAYIDAGLCKNCKKCVSVCPTGAILALNFPEPKVKKIEKEKIKKEEIEGVGTETLPTQKNDIKEEA